MNACGFLCGFKEVFQSETLGIMVALALIILTIVIGITALGMWLDP